MASDLPTRRQNRKNFSEFLATAAPPASCLFTLAQVDALNNHARRIRLFGHLLADSVEGLMEHDRDKYPHADTIDPLLESLLELVTTTIADAEAIERLIARRSQAATGGGEQKQSVGLNRGNAGKGRAKNDGHARLADAGIEVQ
jgi:hypothetical protein